MKTQLFNRLNCLGIKATLLGLSLSLVACAASLAESTLVSVTLQPAWPATSEPGNVVLYTVTVTRAGEGELTVGLSSANLPPGATGSFSLNPVRFTGRTPKTLTSTLAIACTNLTATDQWPFSISATQDRGALTLTNILVPNEAVSAAAQAVAAPRLFLDRLNATSMRLRGLGVAGQIYQVQCTSSLSHPLWTAAGSSTTDGNGRFTFLDSNTNLPAARFYRVVMPSR